MADQPTTKIDSGVILTVGTVCADCGKAISGKMTLLVYGRGDYYGPYCDLCNENKKVRKLRDFAEYIRAEADKHPGIAWLGVRATKALGDTHD